MKICQNCGATWSDETEVCTRCGTALPASADTGDEPFLRRHRGRIVTYGVVALAFAVIVTAIAWLFISDRDNAGLCYRQGDRILFLTGDEEPVAVWSGDGAPEDLRRCGGGKYLFFLADGTLYRVELKKPVPQIIAEDVTDYAVSADGKRAAVLHKDGTLCTVVGKEASEIGRDVTEFVLSDDGKSVLFRVGTGEIYKKNGGAKAKLQCEKTDRLLYVSPDLSEFFAERGNSLLRKSGWGGAAVWLTDKAQCLGFDEWGRCYLLDPDGTFHYFDGNDRQTLAENVTAVEEVRTVPLAAVVSTEKGERILFLGEEPYPLGKTQTPQQVLLSALAGKDAEGPAGTWTVYAAGHTVFVLTGERELYRMEDGKAVRAAANADAVSPVPASTGRASRGTMYTEFPQPTA